LKNKILYITYDGLTDQLGQSQVLPYLCELSGLGYKFHLISCEKPEKFKAQRAGIEDICSKNNISWHPLAYTKTPPVYSTIKDITSIKRTAFELEKLEHFDMVHCRGYIPALVGLQLKKKRSVHFLFDMRGLWANEKVDAGSWNLGNPIYRSVFNYFKKKEKQFLENADYTISLTHAAQKEIFSWDHIENNPVKMEVIPCCADLSHFDPSTVDAALVSKIRQDTGIPDGVPVLSYLGSIGSWYMLSEMLDFFKVYCERYPSAYFFFITGDQHDLIRQRAIERKIDPNKIIIRPATRREVPASIALSTHSVFFIRPTYSKISSSPTKQAELMGMGVPVITNDGVGDTSAIIERYGSGIVITDFSESGYREAINRLKDFCPGDVIRQGAISYFSLSEGVKRYQQVYEKILN
jgi:glycosyltransferase involved in cell wall biosynthesis